MGKHNIVVVGGGPAGMMAAIRAAELACPVELIEKKSRLANKLLLSGKGRCNLTNNCALDDFLPRFSHGEFLRDAFKVFFNRELMEFFEKNGLRLKVERQQRVFPASDRADSVVQLLLRKLRELKVKVSCSKAMIDLAVERGAVRAVIDEKGRFIPAEAVILATGGVSYPFTGSTGEGLEIARKFGHRITALRPSLVPLDTSEGFVKELQGLSLENVRIKFFAGKSKLSSDIGELLFTDSGVSGALVLSSSARVSDWLAQAKQVRLRIDLKPALTNEQLEQRLLRELKLNSRKALRNMLKALLPARMVEVFISLLGIDGLKICSYITQQERRAILALLKGFPLSISSCRPIAEAMVTRGGVSLKEINPRTMESGLLRSLYFCGEMIDVDADTGGFNLQAAFSTGYLAGQSAATALLDPDS